MKLEIFVPVAPQEAALQCRSALVERFGGTTSYSATGHWKSPSGIVIDEPVTVETIYTENVAGIEAIAKQYKEAGKQEAVLYVVDSKPHFI